MFEKINPTTTAIINLQNIVQNVTYCKEKYKHKTNDDKNKTIKTLQSKIQYY